MLCVFHVEEEKEFGSLYQVVDLVFGGVLDDQAVVEVEVVVEAEDVHSSVIDHVGLAAFVVVLVVDVVEQLIIPVFIHFITMNRLIICHTLIDGSRVIESSVILVVLSILNHVHF